MTSADVVVKVTTQHPAWPLLRQTPSGAGVWGRYRFVVNEPVEVCDYWVVCDGLLQTEQAHCPPANTLLVTWEPPVGVRHRYHPRFLGQFGTVLTCDPTMNHPDVVLGQQGQPWFVGRSYDALQSSAFPEKTLSLVIVTSNKTFSPGHAARFEFAVALKAHFGDAARLVGRGIEDFDDKWDVLAPARYAIAAENGVFADYLTEKLPDCYLAGAFPLYYGAPNASRYFPGRSFETVDVHDVQRSIGLIEALLADDSHYERSLPHLAVAKRRYLDNLQLFPLLAGLLDRALTIRPSAGARSLVLHPEPQPGSAIRRVARRLARR